MKNIDRKIALFMQEKLSNPVLDRILVSITELGDFCFIWLVFSVIFYLIDAKTFALLMVLSMLVTNAINNGLIKSLFRRKRPYEKYEDIHTIIPEPYGSSFPSGHSATAFGSAVVIMNYNIVLGSVVLLLAILIAFSRVYLRVHFASDVFVGSLVGFLTTLYVVAFYWSNYA